MPRSRPRIGFLFGYLAYEYDTGMWRGLLRAAEARGVDLIAIECSTDHAESPASQRAQRSLVAGLDLDGMVVAGTMGFTLLDTQIEQFLSSLSTVPMVLVARSFASRPSVFIDNRAGILTMMEHLVKVHGRRRVAFIAGHAHGGDAIQRYDAYREALDIHGLKFDSSLVYRPSGEYDPFVGAKAVKKIWGEEDQRPDALVANNDDAAISAVEELVRLGFDVPGKVSVAGFDDIGPCLDVKPHLTTVRQPHLEIGEAAIEILLKAMKGVAPGPGPVTVPGVAVFRRSCGCSSSEAEAHSRAAPSRRNVAARLVVMERLQKLIDASLASEDPDIFLDGLDAAVSGEDSAEPLYELWLDRLKGLFAGRGQAASPGAVQGLYQAGLERLGNATNAIERSRQARTRNSYNILNSFFSRSAFTFDPAGAGDALVESLPQLGIRDFMLCLYLGTPERARVQRVLPEGRESGLSPGDQGSPQELVMRFMEERTTLGGVRPLVLMPLHHDGSDLGFVICGVGSPDGSLYLALQSQLSNRLKGNALLEAVRDYSHELETRVKTLSGFLPICASCKKIRDDKGYWNQVEAYISEHSEVEFSHGLCPECARKLYPDIEQP
jgi:DNA-binding LacI/PurR family transcriptional regulator